MKNNEFIPKLVTVWKAGISREQWTRDILAGITVGIVALPLSIAFAIASGVSPEKGLVTAIIAGFLISALGGSRVQIGGPTGAFIVIVYGIVQEFGVEGLTIATLMAGVLIIGMGLARLGNYLKFIPYPLIVGFTSGIALIIFSSQIKDLLGLQMGGVPADFLEKWRLYAEHIGTSNAYSVAIAAGTILIALQFHRITKKIPGSIVAIVLGTAAVHFFHIPVETIASRFGDIPNRISVPTFPDMDLATIKKLIQPAVAIALLGGIESLLSAVVADGMIGDRHRSNIELVAQGSANIASALFAGIPATGAIARTATNIRNGARTPISGMIHAVVLLLIMLVLGPAAKLIPLATLAGILVVVAWHMGEWHHFFSMMKSNRMDVLVLLTTFFLTVFFDLIIAIEVGMILASFIFMKRMSESTYVGTLGEGGLIPVMQEGMLFEEELKKVPEGVVLYEINGPLFFGASQKFQEIMTDLHQQPRVLILRMRHVPFIDATGISRLKEVCQKMRAKGTEIYISGANPQLKSDLLDAKGQLDMGEDQIFPTISEALAAAEKQLVRH